MRATIAIIFSLVAFTFVRGEYNRPSCGTASKCGAPIHDFLHDLTDRVPF